MTTEKSTPPFDVELGFRIAGAEDGYAPNTLVWDTQGCRPATLAEVRLWEALGSLRTQLAQADKLAEAVEEQAHSANTYDKLAAYRELRPAVKEKT